MIEILIAIDQENANTIILKYELKMDPGFEFVKGGKLPGLYGGKPGCSGGKRAKNCFSCRFIWKEDGLAGVYVYFPKRQVYEFSVFRFCKFLTYHILVPIIKYNL